MEFSHQPVLLEEILGFVPQHFNTALDLTLGGAGHAKALLHKNPGLRLVGVDRDPEALEKAQIELSDFTERVEFLHSGYAQAVQGMIEEKRRFDFVMADLGVSSYQLDNPSRGFSFSKNGPLDMRMDPRSKLSAFEVVNGFDEKKLAKIIFEFGEEKASRKIASMILERRKSKPFETTLDLAQAISSCLPAFRRRQKIHPATKTFQAIRIYVNSELEELKNLLSMIDKLLEPKGRAAILSFHSLEDRLVKRCFQRLEKPCQCPPHIPKCICGLEPVVKRLTSKAVKASELESKNNPRARSVRLRVIEKL